MSEMQSDTAAVAVDTRSSDNTAELPEMTAVADDDSEPAVQMRQTSEVCCSFRNYALTHTLLIQDS